MLPSLRPLIAQSMRDLALLDHGVQEWQSAILGARTLEWCDANDPDSDPCQRQDSRVDELESAIDDVRAALIAWSTSIDKKRHAVLKEEIGEILTGVGL